MYELMAHLLISSHGERVERKTSPQNVKEFFLQREGGELLLYHPGT